MYPNPAQAAVAPICPTPKINALLVLVSDTENCLGRGAPALGAEYEALAGGLHAIADELQTISRAKTWQGVAGKMFFAWNLALSVNLGIIAGIDQKMAPVIAKQGTEVGIARNAINAIRNDLLLVRAILEKLAEINIESALSLDSSNALAKSAEYESIVQSLTATTSTNQAELSKLCQLLASYEGRLGMESCMFIPDSTSGAAMSVDPNNMIEMRSSLNSCLVQLDALSSKAAQNLAHVRLTHGTGGITEPINVSLTRFVGHHESILSAAIDRVSRRESELMAVNSTYVRRDAEVASILMG